MDSAGKARRTRGQTKALVTRKLKGTRELIKSGSVFEMIKQNLNKVYEYLSELKHKHDQYLSLLAESNLEGEGDYLDMLAAQVDQVAADVWEKGTARKLGSEKAIWDS